MPLCPSDFCLIRVPRGLPACDVVQCLYTIILVRVVLLRWMHAAHARVNVHVYVLLLVFA